MSWECVSPLWEWSGEKIRVERSGLRSLSRIAAHPKAHFLFQRERAIQANAIVPNPRKAFVAQAFQSAVSQTFPSAVPNSFQLH